MSVPKSFIEEVNRRTQIALLIREFIPLKEDKKNLRGVCPFCRHYGFTVSPAKNIFKCFRCQKGGDAFEFVRLMQRRPFLEVLEFLAKRLGMEMPVDVKNKS